jgi:purine-nucleoside phosphorylase
MNKVALVVSFVLGVLACAVGYHFFKPCYPFPNIPEKYRFQSALTPRQFFDYQKNKGKAPAIAAPKTLIVCCDSGLLENILQKYRTQSCHLIYADVHVLTDYPSTAIALFGLTSPLNAMMLELAIAWGIKQMIFIGTACSLQKNLVLGDIVVCEKAIRDEGVSHHYLAPSKYVYPAEPLQKKLLVMLNAMNKKYRFGAIWTTDAFFRETIQEISQYQKEGVLGVEMETAGLLSVAAFNHIDAVALYTVTDSYANLVWEKGLGYRQKKIDTLEQLFEIALKI